MPWVAPVAAIIGAGASVYSIKTSADARSDAKDIAAENKRLAALENERQRKLQTEANEELLAKARAKAAGAGTGGVSESLFLDQLKRKSVEELKWLDTVGAANIRSTTLTGESAVTKAGGEVVSAFGKFAGATSKAFTSYQEYTNPPQN